MLRHIVLLCSGIIVLCSAQYQFTEKHYIERRCDYNILLGFKNCKCDYKPTTTSNITSNITSNRIAYQLIWVNCTNTGFTSVESLQYLHQFSNNLYTYHYTELEVFIFTGNNIGDMPPNFVGRSTMENLAYLDLSNNHIRTIKGKSFHSMPNLLELYLDNNEWFVDANSPRAFSSIFNLEILSLNNAFSELPPGQAMENHATHLSKVFEGSSLDYLRELYLENNRLYFVHESTFQHLESLEKLSLAHNYLNDLNHVFNATCFPSVYVADYFAKDNLCKLQSLDLSYNQIETVPKLLLDQLDNAEDFKELNLKGNPLRCDCDLIDFYNWLKYSDDGGSVIQPEDLICSQPANLAGQSLTSLAVEDLKCHTHSTASDFGHSSHAGGIVIGILLALIAVGVIVGLIINRKTVLAESSKVWQSTKRYVPFGKLGYDKVEEPAKEPVSV